MAAAEDLVGFDGTLVSREIDGENRVGYVRIRGGRALYDSVEYRSDESEKVRLSREAATGYVNRYVDPSTELELVFPGNPR